MFVIPFRQNGGFKRSKIPSETNIEKGEHSRKTLEYMQYNNCLFVNIKINLIVVVIIITINITIIVIIRVPGEGVLNLEQQERIITDKTNI